MAEGSQLYSDYIVYVEYYKKNDERGGSLKFHRDISYEGKHLLRCRVKNSRKGFDITKVFIVDGYK